MKQKINLQLALIALIAVLAATVGTTLVYYNLFQSQVKSDLRMSALLLSDTEVFQSVYDSGSEAESKALARLEDYDLRITWIAADGTVLYDNDTDVSGLSNHLDRPEIQEALLTGSGESVRTSDTFKMNTFYYALALEDGTVLRVSTQARSITSVFVSALPVIAAICILILAVCILLGHLLARQLIRPINAMAEHMDDPVSGPVYKELEPFAEKIRTQHEKILEAATSRQEFTANVSHELKTPLTAISGYAELIENRMIDETQQVHIAQQIRQNSDRLLSLINDIIRLSDLDRSEVRRVFLPLDLSDVAADCCRNLKVSAEARKISLSFHGESAPVTGDRDMLRELTENLVQNAIRYNRENGTVKVEVSQEDGHALLRVSDTGIGIPPNQLDRIFERFYRVDKSRSRENGGTGLGLAIVKHIAELHGARITVESTLGTGSVFTVRF